MKDNSMINATNPYKDTATIPIANPLLPCSLFALIIVNTPSTIHKGMATIEHIIIMPPKFPANRPHIMPAICTTIKIMSGTDKLFFSLELMAFGTVLKANPQFEQKELLGDTTVPHLLQKFGVL